MKKLKTALACIPLLSGILLLIKKMRSEHLNECNEHQANDFYVPDRLIGRHPSSNQ